MPKQASEAAVLAVGNRYDLVLIATQRVRELRKGHQPKVKTNSGTIVTALEEIQAGHSKLIPTPGVNQTIVTGNGGPSGTGKKPTGDTIFPPPGNFLKFFS